MKELVIGTIINTHGIKGEVKIRSCSDFDEVRYKKGNTVYLKEENSLTELKVRSFRVHKGFPLVSFEGLNSINDVEKYRDCDVVIDADERQPLPEGDYYYSDLEGMDVYDEAGSRIGRCSSVEPTLGAQNNLRITLEDGRQVLIPYVPAFIRSVSIDENRIIVNLMEGLI